VQQTDERFVDHESFAQGALASLDSWGTSHSDGSRSPAEPTDGVQFTRTGSLRKSRAPKDLELEDVDLAQTIAFAQAVAHAQHSDPV